MSQENVEIARRAHQAFNDRNLDALLASFTDDAEWRLIGGFADLIGTEFRGHEGLRRLFNEWVDNLGLQSEMEAVLDADDRVAVTLRVTGAGGASGVPTTIRSGNVYFSATGRSARSTATTRQARPSKPWGWRSRRCRRRTWS